MVASYCLTIMESELFVADLGDINRCHGKLDSAFIMSWNSVSTIRSVYEVMRNWRMMWSLLDIEVSTISTFCLVCLSKNWVERFFKALTFIYQCHRARHNHLESLKWILNWGCIIQIVTIDALYHWNALYYTFCLHTFNRKTDLGQVEFARKDLFSDHLDDFGSATS